MCYSTSQRKAGKTQMGSVRWRSRTLLHDCLRGPLIAGHLLTVLAGAVGEARSARSLRSSHECSRGVTVIASASLERPPSHHDRQGGRHGAPVLGMEFRFVRERVVVECS